MDFGVRWALTSSFFLLPILLVFDFSCSTCASVLCTEEFVGLFHVHQRCRLSIRWTTSIRGLILRRVERVCIPTFTTHETKHAIECACMYACTRARRLGGSGRNLWEDDHRGHVVAIIRKRGHHRGVARISSGQCSKVRCKGVHEWSAHFLDLKYSSRTSSASPSSP